MLSISKCQNNWQYKNSSFSLILRILNMFFSVHIFSIFNLKKNCVFNLKKIAGNAFIFKCHQSAQIVHDKQVSKSEKSDNLKPIKKSSFQHYFVRWPWNFLKFVKMHRVCHQFGTRSIVWIKGMSTLVILG